MSSTTGVNSGSRPKKLHSFSAPGLSRVGLLVPGISPKSWSLTMMRRVNSTMAARRARATSMLIAGRNTLSLVEGGEASTISVRVPPALSCRWCWLLV